MNDSWNKEISKKGMYLELPNSKTNADHRVRVGEEQGALVQ